MSETIEPYTTEAPAKRGASGASVGYAAASIVIPFIVWFLLSVVLDQSNPIVNVVRLVFSIIMGVTLSIFGISMVKIAFANKQNPAFAIIGLVLSALYAVFSIFLGLVVVFALIAVRLQ